MRQIGHPNFGFRDKGIHLKNAETITAAPALQRVVGVTGVAFSSFNGIVGSGIFGLPALVAALLGPAAILAYLVCVVLVALMGLCFAEVGSRVHSAGGLYGYAHASFGPVIGGIAGTLIWTAGSVVSSAAVASFLASTLAVLWPVFDQPVPRALFTLFLYGGLAFINIRGTRLGAGFSIGIGLAKLAPLILLVVAGAFAIHLPNLHWTGLPALKTVGQGAVLLFFAFMGVETGLGMSGEIRQPARTVPRAIALALTLIAFLYIGLQLVAQGVLGPDLAVEKAPLVATAHAIFGPAGTTLLVVATVLSGAGTLAGGALCSPRYLYALAEAGQLPRPLAKVDPRFGTPANAILVYAAICAVLACSGTFHWLVIFSSSGSLVLYLICALGLLQLRARNVTTAAEPFRAPGGSAVPIAAAAIIVWMLSTLKWSELIATAALVIATGLAYWLLELRRDKSSRVP